MPKNDRTEHLPSPNKHRKINPTCNNFNTITTTSSPQEVAVIVNLDFHFGSKLLTNFYKIISKFKLNSNIINNNNIFLLNEIMYHTKHHSSQSIPPQLLYRGSRDGFKYHNFHSQCDYQGPTLTIIKSANEPNNNQIFGGFTTQSWKSPSASYGEWISDGSAFLFKIDNENNQFRKFNMKKGQAYNAIWAHTNYLPTFGSGNDILICSDCNLNNNSYSIFGWTFELPIDDNEYQLGSEKANSYLAGSYKFKVSEIEVFKIIQ